MLYPSYIPINPHSCWFFLPPGALFGRVRLSVPVLALSGALPQRRRGESSASPSRHRGAAPRPGSCRVLFRIPWPHGSWLVVSQWEAQGQGDEEWVLVVRLLSKATLCDGQKKSSGYLVMTNSLPWKITIFNR